MMWLRSAKNMVLAVAATALVPSLTTAICSPACPIDASGHINISADSGYSYDGCQIVVSVGFSIPVTTAGGFQGASALRAVWFADSVRDIQASGFASTNVTSVEFPDSVNTIGDSAFLTSTALASVDFGAALVSIGTSAFQGCTALASANFSVASFLTTIGESAFEGCSSLTSFVMPPRSLLTSISASAFAGCTSLARLELPSSLLTLGPSAFASTMMPTVAIPDSVTSIGEMAFSNCANLVSLYVGSSVWSIGDGAFFGCSSLTTFALPSGRNKHGGGSGGGSGGGIALNWCLVVFAIVIVVIVGFVVIIVFCCRSLSLTKPVLHLVLELTILVFDEVPRVLVVRLFALLVKLLVVFVVGNGHLLHTLLKGFLGKVVHALIGAFLKSAQ
mmetsp:Transcript_16823/g.49545  ORF Transcript_16823/g.49545 Transcript_16823/m.49545 type:complete len:390 (+) Transcript_16823:69-1238(+)